jgi:hypothetical protein
MLASPRFTEASEKPSRLQLAITEWQRQLVAMREAADDGRPTRAAMGRAD